MMTTLDAPYWLRWAREYNENTYGQLEGLRDYPKQTETFQKLSENELFLPQKYTDTNPSYLSSSGTPEIRYFDVPLLSFLIAHLAPFFDYNYYLTGTLLVPVLASLFILPLGIYFFCIGIPASGLLGGLIGTFAGGYFLRSSIGRIDTDMLNLFFPTLSALLILLASQAKTDRYVILFSAGTGLNLFFFQWWYDRAGFMLAYLIVLVFSLFIHQIKFRTILLSVLIFVLCANPKFVLHGSKSVEGFLNNYFIIEETKLVLNDKFNNPAKFPNTMTTISEVDHVKMEEVFRRVLSNIVFDWAGVIALFGLAVLRWRALIPLLPMLALGLLSFQSSNRFIMYFAPFIGIGLGFLLQLTIDGVFLIWYRKLSQKIEKNGLAAHSVKKDSKVIKGRVGSSKVEGKYWDTITHQFSKYLNVDTKKYSLQVQSYQSWNWVRQGSLYFFVGLFFWGVSSQTAIYFVPGPSIHPKLYATFLEVKKRVSEDSALLTWWDYGYAITDATGLATFHDGSSQKSPKTYFTARGLISTDQQELYDITQYLSTEGNQGIVEDNTSPEALLAAVRNPKQKPWNPIYLFFTADMTGKYGAISKLGSWDIFKGGSKPRGYRNLNCNKITNEEMFCQGAKFDLKAGLINNQLALRRLIFLRNGQVLRELEFKHSHGLSIQLIVSGSNIVEVQLIDEEVFRSNYNQMFLLGRYRADLFEETYNATPLSRLYRVKF